MDDFNTDGIIESRFIRLPEVKRISGLAKSTIYKKIKEKTFPEQFLIASKAVAWDEKSIQNWRKEIIESSKK